MHHFKMLPFEIIAEIITYTDDIMRYSSLNKKFHKILSFLFNKIVSEYLEIIDTCYPIYHSSYDYQKNIIFVKDTNEKNIVFLNSFVRKVILEIAGSSEILKTFPNIREVNIDISKTKNKYLDEVIELFDIYPISKICCIDYTYYDNDISYIKYFPQNKVLEIPSAIINIVLLELKEILIPKITQLYLKCFCNENILSMFSNLTHLTIQINRKISGIFLKEMPKLKYIKTTRNSSFSFDEKCFNYDNLVYVSNTLECLDVASQEKNRFKYLKKLINLTHLTLSNSCLEETIGPQLQYMTNLKYLSISANNVIEEKYIKLLTNLETLKLFACTFTGKCFRYLKNIKKLNISCCDYFDESNLEYLINLENIKVRNIIFTGKYLKYLKNIRAITLYNCKKLIDEYLDESYFSEFTIIEIY